MQYSEIFVWIITAFVCFYLFNSFFYLRTAASLFLSILISTIVIVVIYNSYISESLVALSLAVGAIYAIPRAFRDKRDDCCKTTV